MTPDTPEGNSWDVNLKAGMQPDAGAYNKVNINQPSLFNTANSLFRNEVMQEMYLKEGIYGDTAANTQYRVRFNDDGVPIVFRQASTSSPLVVYSGKYTPSAAFSSTGIIGSLPPELMTDAFNIGIYNDIVAMQPSGANTKYFFGLRVITLNNGGIDIAVDKIDAGSNFQVIETSTRGVTSYNPLVNVFFIKKNSYTNTADALGHAIVETLNAAGTVRTLDCSSFGAADVSLYGMGTFRNAYINGGTIVVSGYRTAYITSANWATNWAINATFVDGAAAQFYGNMFTYQNLDSLETTLVLGVVATGLTQAGNNVPMKKIAVSAVGVVTVTNATVLTNNLSTDKTITQSSVPGGVAGQLVTGGTYAQFSTISDTTAVGVATTIESTTYTATYGLIPEVMGTIRIKDGVHLRIIAKNGVPAMLQVVSIDRAGGGQNIYDFGDLYTEITADLFDNNTGTWNGGNAWMPCPLIVTRTTGTYYIIFKNAAGEQVIIVLSTLDALNKFTLKKIARNVYKINTVSDYCILDTNNNVLIQDCGTISRTWVSPNTTVATLYGGSALTTDIDQSNAYSAFVQESESTFAKTIQFYHVNTKTAIDIFVNAVYKTTSSYVQGGAVISTARYFFDESAGTAYVSKGDTQELPIPAYANITDNGVQLLKDSALRLDNYSGYYAANALGFSATLFRLFGNDYAFDETWIYAIPVNGGIISLVDRLALANGLTFLCQSPSVAYFTSSFDSSLYGFDGGREVQKLLVLSGINTTEITITTGVFNVATNTLWLSMGTNWYQMCDGQMLKADILTADFPYVSNCDRNAIFSSDTNAHYKIIQFGNRVYYGSDLAYLIDTTQPLVLGTQFYSYEDNSSMEVIRIILYFEMDETYAPFTIATEFTVLTPDARVVESRTITITAADIYSPGLYYCSYIPGQQYGVAAKLQITRQDPSTLPVPVKLHSMTWYTKRVGDAIITDNV